MTSNLMRTCLVALCLALPNIANGGLLSDFAAKVEQVGEGKSPYPVIAAGYWVVRDTRVHWIDNETVLFSGNTLSEWELAERERRAPKPALHLWKPQRGEATRHAETTRFGGFCYSQGHIRYPLGWDESSIRIAEGIFGREQEAVYERWHESNGARNARRMLYSELRCKEVSFDVVVRDPPRTRLFPLLERHGYLDLDMGNFFRRGHEPVKYYREGESVPLALPIKKRNVTSSDIRYYAWNDSYVLTGPPYWTYILNDHQLLARSESYPVHLLRADGLLSRMDVPFIEGVTSWAKYVPTPKGWLVIAAHTNVKKPDDPGSSGIYLLSQQPPMRMAKGVVQMWDLSPDGCKLVVGMRQVAITHSPTHLSMIDLCAKEQ